MKPTKGQRLAIAVVGKLSEVPDLDETGKWNIEQETADEIDRLESRDAAVVIMSGRKSRQRKRTWRYRV